MSAGVLGACDSRLGLALSATMLVRGETPVVALLVGWHAAADAASPPVSDAAGLEASPRVACRAAGWANGGSARAQRPPITRQTIVLARCQHQVLSFTLKCLQKLTELHWVWKGTFVLKRACWRKRDEVNRLTVTVSFKQVNQRRNDRKHFSFTIINNNRW